MRENLYHLALLVLVLACLFLVGRESLGLGQPVSVSVSPNLVIASPYKTVGFRFRWQIDPHKDNRQYALAYSCGVEIASSQGEVRGEDYPRTHERIVFLTVIEDCDFMACVVRIVNGKPRTYCDHQTVSVGGSP